MHLNHLSKPILSLLISALLVGCSGGGDSETSDNSSEQNETVEETTSKQVERELSLGGSAVDGYITNAIVCLDLNKNNYCDLDSEPATSTDSKGKYKLDATAYKSHANFTTANILVFDGYDSDTGKRFTGKYFAPQDGTFTSGSVNVTAMTTLVAKIVESGETIENAKTQVKTALNIPANIDVSADPLELLNSGEPGAADFIGKNIALNRSISTMVAAASQDTTLANSNDSQISNNVFDALAATVKASQNSTDTKSVESLVTKMATDPTAKQFLKSKVLEKAATVAAITAKKTTEIYTNTQITNAAEAQAAAVNATKVEEAASSLVKSTGTTSVIKLDDTFAATAVKTQVETETAKVKQITVNELAVEFLTLAGISISDIEKAALSGLAGLATQSPFSLEGLKTYLSSTANYANSTALKSVVSKITQVLGIQNINPLPETAAIVPGRDILTRAVSNTANAAAIAENCPVNGGIQLDVGIDMNADGKLQDSEVDPSRTQYICHGADGKDGANGKDGAAGPTGATGAKGADGQSAYQVWLDAGNTGTEADFLASLKGTNGVDGATGTNGTDGVDGQSAYQIWLAAGNTGTDADFLASLKGTNGVDGAAGTNGVDGVDGQSAYQIWLAAGNTGTEADFLASLKGTNGIDGADGQSAYQIWLGAGNTGTEADFLASLKGANGTGGSSPILTSSSPIDFGQNNCAQGGVLLSVGQDANNNTILDATEVQSTSPICYPNLAPSFIAYSQLSPVVSSDYRFEVDGQDADNNSFTFNVVNKPAWLNVASTTSKTLVLTGKAPALVGDKSKLEISVSDGEAVTTKVWDLTTKSGVAVTVTGAQLQEGAEGNITPTGFTVNLSKPLDADIVLSYQVSSQSLVQGIDYEWVSSAPYSNSDMIDLRIPAGSTSANIDINVLGDNQYSPDQQLWLDPVQFQYTGAQTVYMDSFASIDIQNDDTAIQLDAGSNNESVLYVLPVNSESQLINVNLNTPLPAGMSIEGRYNYYNNNTCHSLSSAEVDPKSLLSICNGKTNYSAILLKGSPDAALSGTTAQLSAVLDIDVIDPNTFATKRVVIPIDTTLEILETDTDQDGVVDSLDAFPNNMLGSVDSDADGIGDEWETQQFGNLTDANATSNFDSKGYTDLEAFQNQLHALAQKPIDFEAGVPADFVATGTGQWILDNSTVTNSYKFTATGTYSYSSSDFAGFKFIGEIPNGNIQFDYMLDAPSGINPVQIYIDGEQQYTQLIKSPNAWQTTTINSYIQDNKGLHTIEFRFLKGNFDPLTTISFWIDNLNLGTAFTAVRPIDLDGDGVLNQKDLWPNNAIAAYDIDADGIGDAWERLNFGAFDLSVASGTSDFDSDGLLDIEEFELGTSPNNSDTDGDGVFDGTDIAPNNWQYKEDTDLDGIADEWETAAFGDLITADATTDYDGDGVLDIDEFKNGTSAAPDSDGDGVADPLDPAPNDPQYSQDSDRDGLPDEWEISYIGWVGLSPQNNWDGDGFTDLEEFQNGTDPTVANFDADLDGIDDNWELSTFGNLTTADATTDYDGDGVLDIDEYKNGTQAAPDTDGDGVSDLVDPFPNDAAYVQDSNTNGLPDEWEYLYGYGSLGMLPPQGDSDMDGYTNLQEFQNGTNPTVADFNAKIDYIEVIAGQSTNIDVLANDSLGNAGALTVTAVTQPTVGSISLNADNTLTYTSAATDGGNQMVEVTLTDGSLTTTSALIIHLLDANTPTLVEVSTGASHSLMLMSDGSVYAWGANSNGQLGDGTTINQTIPVQANISNVAVVFATGDSSFVTLNDGTAWELGTTNKQLMMPDGVSPLMNLQKIVGDKVIFTSKSALGLDNQGNVYRLGFSSYLPGVTFPADAVSVVTDSDGVTPLTGIVDIAAGTNHKLALRNTGEVIAWGSNNVGQIGNGTNTDSTTPVVVSKLTNIVQIAAAASNSYAVDNLGDVYAWGSMTGIGDGNQIDRNVPVKVPNVANVTTLNVGAISQYGFYVSAYAQTSTNDSIWGESSNNQLLSYSYAYAYATPQNITAYKPTTFSMGQGFSVFTENNTLYSVGANDQGQLGVGSTVTSTTPVKVVLSSDSVVSGNQGENFEWGMIPPRWASSSWLITQDTAVVKEGITSVEVTDALTDGQSATLEANVFTAAGDVTYQYKVSSEQDFDTLTFSVDGVVKATYSGEVAWTLSTPVTLTAGQHKLTWTYTKDGGTSVGQDKAWIDDIQFPFDSDKDGVADLLDTAPYDATVQ